MARPQGTSLKAKPSPHELRSIPLFGVLKNNNNHNTNRLVMRIRNRVIVYLQLTCGLKSEHYSPSLCGKEDVHKALGLTPKGASGAECKEKEVYVTGL